MTAVETEVVESCHSSSADRLVFFRPSRSHGFLRITPESGKNFASLGRPFKRTVVASRQSKVDWRAAAQSREARCDHASRQRLADGLAALPLA